MRLEPWWDEGLGSSSGRGCRSQSIPKSFQLTWVHCGWGTTGHSGMETCHGWLPQQPPELWCNRMAGNALGKQALSLGKHTLPQNLFQGPICKQSGISILIVNVLHTIPSQPSSKAIRSQVQPSWADSAACQDLATSTSPDKNAFLGRWDFTIRHCNKDCNSVPTKQQKTWSFPHEHAKQRSEEIKHKAS